MYGIIKAAVEAYIAVIKHMYVHAYGSLHAAL